MITDYHKEFLKNNLALWIGSADRNNVPDSIRCLGVVVEDESVLRCFIAKKFSERFFDNISENKQVAVLTSHPFTFTGYQYKGEVIELMPCLQEEVEIQIKYMDEFASGMAAFGLEKQPVFDMYYSQPSLSVRVRIHKIFDQTPKPNTGQETEL